MAETIGSIQFLIEAVSTVEKTVNSVNRSLDFLVRSSSRMNISTTKSQILNKRASFALQKLSDVTQKYKTISNMQNITQKDMIHLSQRYKMQLVDVAGTIGVLSHEMRRLAGTYSLSAEKSDRLINTADKLDKSLKPLDGMINAVNKDLEKMDKAQGRLVNAGRKLTMAWLGIMFGARQIQKAFGALNKTIMENYFAGELLGIQYELMGAMAPVLDPLMEILYKLVDAFYGLPEPVKMFIGIIISLIAIFAGIIAAVATVILFITAIGGAFSGVWTVAAGLAVIMKVLVGAFTLLTGPVGLIILGIIALIAIIVLLIKNKEKLKEIFTKVWNAITSVVNTAIEKIKGLLRPVYEELFPRIIKILDIVKSVWTSTWDFIKGVLSSIWNNVIKPVGNLIITIFSKIGEKLWDYLKPIWDTVMGLLEKGWNALGTAIKWVWDTIIKPPLDAFITFMEKVAEVYNRTIGKIGEWFTGVTKTFKAEVEVKTKKIAELQYGGIVPGPIGAPVPAIVHGGETWIPPGKAGGFGTINFSPVVNITATTTNEMDWHDISDKMMSSWKSELRRLI